MMNKPTKYGLILVLALVTVAGVIYFDTRYRDAQYQEAVARFQLLGTLRSSTLQTYFNTARAEVSAWSLSERIHQSMLELRAGWNQLVTFRVKFPRWAASEAGNATLRLIEFEAVDFTFKSSNP